VGCEPALEPIEPAVAVARPGRDFQFRVEVVQVPSSQPVLDAGRSATRSSRRSVRSRISCWQPASKATGKSGSRRTARATARASIASDLPRSRPPCARPPCAPAAPARRARRGQAGSAPATRTHAGGPRVPTPALRRASAPYQVTLGAPRTAAGDRTFDGQMRGPIGTLRVSPPPVPSLTIASVVDAVREPG
jgi:hypothetical protein